MYHNPFFFLTHVIAVAVNSVKEMTFELLPVNVNIDVNIFQYLFSYLLWLVEMSGTNNSQNNNNNNNKIHTGRKKKKQHQALACHGGP